MPLGQKSFDNFSTETVKKGPIFHWDTHHDYATVSVRYDVIFKPAGYFVFSPAFLYGNIWLNVGCLLLKELNFLGKCIKQNENENHLINNVANYEPDMICMYVMWFESFRRFF